MVNLQPESAEEAKALIPSLDVSGSAILLCSSRPWIVSNVGKSLIDVATLLASFAEGLSPQLFWLVLRFPGS